MPSATTVTPIIKSETPNNLASLEALSMSMLLPFTNSNIEIMNMATSINFVPHVWCEVMCYVVYKEKGKILLSNVLMEMQRHQDIFIIELTQSYSAKLYNSTCQPPHFHCTFNHDKFHCIHISCEYNHILLNYIIQHVNPLISTAHLIMIDFIAYIFHVNIIIFC